MVATAENRRFPLAHWLFSLGSVVYSSLRALAIWVVSAGPIPHHIAIIMDGNRRFASRRGMNKKSGHEFGSERLISTLRDCYELGVKYVTVYAFSIENFRRSEEEVHALMDLMQQKLESLSEHESLVNRFGIRVRLVGNLELLPERVRIAAEQAMAMSKANDRAVLTICVSYTSTQEIVYAVQGVCNDCLSRIQARGNRLDQLGSTTVCGAVDGKINGSSSFTKEMEIEEVPVAEEEHITAQLESISVKDIDNHLYTSGCPNPDLLIRTGGETRLSNFLLWQSTLCHLYTCPVLWPEFSFRHLLLAVLDYQRAYPFLTQKQAEPKGLPSHSD